MTDYTKVPTDDLFNHALAITLEYEIDNMNELVDDKIDYSLSDIRDYEGSEIIMEDGKPLYVFHCEIEGTVTEQVSRRSRHHSAEYRTETVPIYVDIALSLIRYNGLSTVDVTVKSGGNPFAPPDCEGEWRDI